MDCIYSKETLELITDGLRPAVGHISKYTKTSDLLPVVRTINELMINSSIHFINFEES